MSDSNRTVSCSDCGRPRKETPGPCQCGSSRRTFQVTLVEKISVRDELRGTARDKDQAVVADFSNRSDDTREGTASIDYRAGTVRAGGKQEGFVGKDDEQRRVLEALAAELSRIHGRAYDFELDPLDQDVDGWLWCKDNSEERQAVQLRHLDDGAISVIQRTGTLDDSFTFNDLFQVAENAIASKAEKYPIAIKRQMWLAIHTPYPILDSLMGRMRTALADAARRSGFKEVWVVPFREPAFRID